MPPRQAERHLRGVQQLSARQVEKQLHGVECKTGPNGKVKSRCVDCKPWPHGRLKNGCTMCTPCPHGKRKTRCAEFKAARAALPSSKRVKLEPESSPEIKQEPFTIQGEYRKHFGFDK